MITTHLGAYLLGEVIALPLFAVIRKQFVEGRPTRKVLLMGSFERLLLYLGLVLGYHTILVFFGALKIGTRIAPQDDQAKKVQSDYFLIGNMASVMIVLVDLLLLKLLSSISLA